jgi:mannose-6-phosphate isomerase-like protein (cupin superfamily)
MKIEKAEVHPKAWGKEIWLANTDSYCGKIMELRRGWRCSYHYHKIKDETFFIRKGRLLMEIEGHSYVMHEGDSVRIRPGQKHRFTGLDDGEIIEISTHHDEGDSYREPGMLSGLVPQAEFQEMLERFT